VRRSAACPARMWASSPRLDEESSPAQNDRSSATQPSRRPPSRARACHLPGEEPARTGTTTGAHLVVAVQRGRTGSPATSPRSVRSEWSLMTSMSALLCRIGVAELAHRRRHVNDHPLASADANTGCRVGARPSGHPACGASSTIEPFRSVITHGRLRRLYEFNHQW
jgi:hypothetical protein